MVDWISGVYWEEGRGERRGRWISGAGGGGMEKERERKEEGELDKGGEGRGRGAGNGSSSQGNSRWGRGVNSVAPSA